MSGITRLGTGPRMSAAVVHGGTVYLSGQLAFEARGADAGTQTREILRRIDALLAEAGTDRGQLLSVSIWLADMADFDAMNAEWDAWLPASAAPARATVGAALALPGFAVEIAAVAAIG